MIIKVTDANLRKRRGEIKKQKEEINASCNPATWDHDSAQFGALLSILRTSGPGEPTQGSEHSPSLAVGRD